MIQVKLLKSEVKEENNEMYFINIDDVINDFLVDNGFTYLDVKIFPATPDSVLLVYDDGK